jgi:O-antigen/teichoic acid export membrane protein
LAIAVVAGALAGNVWLFGATALLVVAGAALLSLTGVLRASQDLLPEAVFKLFAGVLTVAAATIACRLEPTAGALVSALALAALAILLPLAGAARKRADFVAGIAPLGALRRAFPLGLLVLGALVYYRSGTIALSVLSTDDETARFAIASALAFGLLAVANAVTTGLMPRLAAERDHGARTLVTRRALAWTAGLGVPFAALAALLGPFAIGLLFGSRYRDAAGPFAVLCAALWLIAASSIIGTALIASGHLRPVLRQTVLSLAVNLVVLALLVPELGAYGAALATVACEVVALMVLWRAANRYLPGVVPFGARGAASAALP